MLQVVYGREDIQRWLLESRRLVTSHVSVKFREHFDRHRSIRAPVLTPALESHTALEDLWEDTRHCRFVFLRIMPDWTGPGAFTLSVWHGAVTSDPWSQNSFGRFQWNKPWIPINSHSLFIFYAPCFLPPFPQRPDSSSSHGQCTVRTLQSGLSSQNVIRALSLAAEKLWKSLEVWLTWFFSKL